MSPVTGLTTGVCGAPPIAYFHFCPPVVASYAYIVLFAAPKYTTEFPSMTADVVALPVVILYLQGNESWCKKRHSMLFNNQNGKDPKFDNR